MLAVDLIIKPEDLPKNLNELIKMMYEIVSTVKSFLAMGSPFNVGVLE